MKRNLYPVLLVLLGILFLFPLSCVQAGGYWQQEAPVAVGVDDKPCGPRIWDGQNGWKNQVYDFSSTHVTFGFFHPSSNVQPYWTKAKAWWQPMPSVLQPGQKISFQYGIVTETWSKWNDARVWLYRMSGPGGGDDQLGYAATQTSATYTSKQHTVPDGFNGSAPNGTRLRYQMGATDGCKVIFSYKWVPDQATATPVTPQKSQITTEPNTDRYGSDYKCIRGIETSSACRSLCIEESECRAYTWVKPGAIEPSSICCLKNAVPSPTQNSNCVSGAK